MRKILYETKREDTRRQINSQTNKIRFLVFKDECQELIVIICKGHTGTYILPHR